jgi:HEAT repeat protein
VIQISGAAATQTLIQAEGRRLAARIRPGDTLLVSFLLPTEETKSGTYFKTTDGSVDKPWTVLSTEEVLNAVARSSAASSLVIFESCSVSQPLVGGEYPNRMAQAPLSGGSQAVTLLTFCARDAKARPGARPFMEEWLKGLNRFVAEAEPRISAMRVATQVREALGGADVRMVTSGYAAEPAFEFIVPQSRLDNWIKTYGKTESPDDKRRLIDSLARDVKRSPVPPTSPAAARTTDVLLATARKPDEAVATRVSATRALAAVGEEAAIPALAKVAADENEGVRRAAVESLGGIPSAAAFAIVSASMKDRFASVRVAAIRAMAVHPSLGSTQPVVAALDDADASVKVAALQSISLIVRRLSARTPAKPVAQKPGAAPLSPTLQFTRADRNKVRTMLRDPAVDVRRDAVSALVALNEDLATRDGFALLKDQASSVRQSIALALGATFSPRVKPEIKAQLVRELSAASAGDTESSVRAAAVWSLGAIGGRDAEQGLIKAANDSAANVRQAVAQGLGKVGGAGSLPQLAVLLQDPDANVRAAAATGLGAMGNSAATEPLLKALEDPNPYVRRNAQAALQKLKPVLTDSFRGALKDSSSKVRVEATQGLARIEDLDAVDLALRQLTDDDPGVWDAAVYALAQRKDAASVTRILEELAADTVVVRMGVVTALGRSQPDRAAPALVARLAREPNAAVRAAIVSSLGYLQPTAAIESALIGRASDPDGSVRQAAATALVAYKSQPAMEALERLVEDEMTDVRSAATVSLRRVGRK